MSLDYEFHTVLNIRRSLTFHSHHSRSHHITIRSKNMFAQANVEHFNMDK